MIARRSVLRAACVAGGAGLLGACTARPAPTPDPDAPPRARLTASPEEGASEVGVTDEISITVDAGALDDVTLTGEDGTAVHGVFADDMVSWQAAEPLGYGKSYRYHATATGTDGKQVELSGSFATVQPAAVVRAIVGPHDTVVGVGMPISVRFDAPVSDRAAAEAALSVTTSSDVEGSWGWLHDKQVDWRPREYWPADTKVTVTARLYGVHYGGGNYGMTDVNTEFTVGRSQIVKIHTPVPEMKVFRDGALFASYPASHGRDDDINLNTPNGTMIVMAKSPTAIFNNERYGYTDVKKKWAVRFSNHGEFIHENEENRANIGKRNTSHGCVNLFESDAKAYYDSALIGDPVEVTGSRLDMPTTSDVNDWLFTWDQWQSMSAR